MKNDLKTSSRPSSPAASGGSEGLKPEYGDNAASLANYQMGLGSALGNRN